MSTVAIDLDTFVDHYLIALAFTAMQECEPEPAWNNPGGDIRDVVSADDVRQVLDDDDLAMIVRDCTEFLAECSENIGDNPSDVESAAHDFHLTRNGHGEGFWDGGWPEPEATALTAASKRFGECELYVTVDDDGEPVSGYLM